MERKNEGLGNNEPNPHSPSISIPTLVYFWVIERKDGTGISEFDPDTGAEFAFRFNFEPREEIASIGLFPFSVQLALKVKVPVGVDTMGYRQPVILRYEDGRTPIPRGTYPSYASDMIFIRRWQKKPIQSMKHGRQIPPYNCVWTLGYRLDGVDHFLKVNERGETMLTTNYKDHHAVYYENTIMGLRGRGALELG